MGGLDQAMGKERRRLGRRLNLGSRWRFWRRLRLPLCFLTTLTAQRGLALLAPRGVIGDDRCTPFWPGLRAHPVAFSDR